MKGVALTICLLAFAGGLGLLTYGILRAFHGDEGYAMMAGLGAALVGLGLPAMIAMNQKDA
jgi:hypothetical protein